jgi:hypothetical protein
MSTDSLLSRLNRNNTFTGTHINNDHTTNTPNNSPTSTPNNSLTNTPNNSPTTTPTNSPKSLLTPLEVAIVLLPE